MAFILDWAIISIAIFPLELLSGFVLPIIFFTPVAVLLRTPLILLIYWALMESGKHQASLGKIVVGIKVADKDGGCITFLRSLARNAGKVVSMITCFIGFMMAGWTHHRQALHDKFTDCYVVR